MFSLKNKVFAIEVEVFNGWKTKSTFLLRNYWLYQ